VRIVEVCMCCPGRSGVCSLSHTGGIEYRYGLVSAGERRILGGHLQVGVSVSCVLHAVCVECLAH